MVCAVLAIYSSHRKGVVMTSVFFISLGALVFFVRAVRRKASRAEWALSIFFLLHTALIIFQQYADNGSIVYESRYYAPANPIVFGWAAYPLALLVSRFKWTIPIFALVFVILVCRVPRDRAVLRNIRADIMEISRQTAEVIRRDWNGPSHECTSPCLSEYRSSRAPAIAAQQTMITYLAGGRQIVGGGGMWWKKPVKEWPEQPDYICLMNFHLQNPDFAPIVRVCESEAYELVEELHTGRFFVRIYRRCRPVS